MNLNELRNRAYRNACNKGFHDKEYSNQHWLMMVITELAEVVEADRKGRRSSTSDMKLCEKLEGEEFRKEYDEQYNNTIESELADVAIRLLDLAGLKDVNLQYVNDGFNIIKTRYRGLRQTVTENIYGSVSLLTDRDGKCLGSIIVSGIIHIFYIAYSLNVNLEWHILQKMRYNELREPMHGNKY